MPRLAIPNLIAVALAVGLVVLVVVSRTGDDGASARSEHEQTSQWLKEAAAGDAAWNKRMAAEANKEKPLPPRKVNPPAPKTAHKASADPHTDDAGSARDYSPPSPRSLPDGEANILTPTEVNAASRDGTALQMVCLESLRGNWKAAEKWLNKSDVGFSLTHAVRKDPDTYYLMPGETETTTFKRSALTVARTIDSPDCMPDIAQRLRDEVYLSSHG